jgi:hypothetical protein
MRIRCLFHHFYSKVISAQMPTVHFAASNTTPYLSSVLIFTIAVLLSSNCPTNACFSSSILYQTSLDIAWENPASKQYISSWACTSILVTSPLQLTAFMTGVSVGKSPRLRVWSDCGATGVHWCAYRSVGNRLPADECITRSRLRVHHRREKRASPSRARSARVFYTIFLLSIASYTLI